jgi:hypothetical protein
MDNEDNYWNGYEDSDDTHGRASASRNGWGTLSGGCSVIYYSSQWTSVGFQRSSVENF